ncbi:MAG: mannitol dehydrogenase family protein [Treponema sp.]|nr:mannitol dehydrogenase family protein [Treponema sp.]
MRLCDKELLKSEQWERAGITLPGFDRAAMIRATEEQPRWVHFGAGNIFRAFPAALAQTMLEQGLTDAGIIIAEGYDGEIIDESFTPFDNLTLLVTLKADGTIGKEVIASVSHSYRMDKSLDDLKKIFAAPSLQMASFTITEKGYELTNRDGLLSHSIMDDINAGPAKTQSYMGRIAALCYERYVRGAHPLALVSMDNCSHNGDKLFAAIDAFAKGWVDKKKVDPGFLNYVRDRQKLSFPWTMIDKITPRPDEGVKTMLTVAGLEDIEGVITSKNTYVAPFVNAEETQYLVIEDFFPNGRPPLEQAGVLFTDRETVDKVEKMKVCTCLNPLHTALAVFGCLLGYTRISDEMKNIDLVKLVEGIGYTEGLPVVVDPGIINPKEFIDVVIKVRLPNPFMPDTPQRIATDTSQKVPIRYGETIKAYLANGLDINRLTFIPLVLAAWLRYLIGIDDKGIPFEISPDPLYSSLASVLGGVRLRQKGPFHSALEPILSNSKIFAVNLYEAGLGEKIETYFEEMMAGPGAVLTTLWKYTGMTTGFQS